MARGRTRISETAASGADEGQPPRDREDGAVELSAIQVLASALAATTAAVLASVVGVAGTLLGAVIFSVVATVASAVQRRLHAAQSSATTQGAKPGSWRAATPGSRPQTSEAVGRRRRRGLRWSTPRPRWCRRGESAGCGSPSGRAVPGVLVRSA